jgi:hypothetical protein
MILTYKKMFENTLNIDQLAICTEDVEGLRSKYRIGFVKKEGLEFINPFSKKLNYLGGVIDNPTGWYIRKDQMKPFDNNMNKNTMPLIYSDKFKNTISYGVKFLSDYEHIYYNDFTFIDTTWKNDTISFLSARDFNKLSPNESPWESSMRQENKISRFITKIVGTIDNKTLENYVNEYKFAFKLNSDILNGLKIAKGVDISRWYLGTNYAEGGGSLNSSCMRYPRSQIRLLIYINNQDKVKLLYLTDSNGKLLGRALLWKLDEPRNTFYMDRIYVTDDYIEKLFLEYAKKRRILTKKEVDDKKIAMKVYLNEDYGPPKMNPFMDTFRFFNRKELSLSNMFNNLKVGEYWEYIDHD